jgi:hypothetical protein
VSLVADSIRGCDLRLGTVAAHAASGAVRDFMIDTPGELSSAHTL